MTQDPVQLLCIPAFPRSRSKRVQSCDLAETVWGGSRRDYGLSIAGEHPVTLQSASRDETLHKYNRSWLEALGGAGEMAKKRMIVPCLMKCLIESRRWDTADRGLSWETRGKCRERNRWKYWLKPRNEGDFQPKGSSGPRRLPAPSTHDFKIVLGLCAFNEQRQKTGQSGAYEWSRWSKWSIFERLFLCKRYYVLTRLLCHENMIKTYEDSTSAWMLTLKTQYVKGTKRIK